MLKSGILNPQLLSLFARVRHTNTLVIADRGFPFWPMVETIDLSLVDNIPTVLQVLDAIRSNFDICEIRMAIEFQIENTLAVKQKYAEAMTGIPVVFEPHVKFKRHVPGAIGLIRTGETIQYSNMILISGRIELPEPIGIEVGEQVPYCKEPFDELDA